jgi:hypothetical protein
MSLEESNGAKFIRTHEDIYVSETAICDIHFSHREERKPGIEPSGGLNPKPTGRRILEAEITVISGEKRYAHDKFAEDLLKLVQARTYSN